ncbi:hypothetical protein ABUL39_09775 [Rhodothermus marinus]|uniref:hypothetical protein n=1 Tax=Rhodothermus marinus TaxID=29549 RepID=UPI0037C6FA21
MHTAWHRRLWAGGWLGVSVLVAFLLLPLKAFSQVSEKRLAVPVAFEAATLEEANARFREEVTAILNRVARAHGLGGVEANWVAVSPVGLMRSPVALLQGRSKLTQAELAAGQALALVDFCLPEGSEVPSGLYVMYVRQENGRWMAALKDLKGRVVLERVAEEGPPGASQAGWPGRQTGIYPLKGRPVYGVRFGVTLADGSFYMVIQLGKGRIVPAQHPDSRAIGKALAAFRRTVRSFFAPWLREGNDVFIATRSDAFMAAVFDPDTNDLVSYLRASRWPGGLYRIRSGQIEPAQPGVQRLAGTFRRVSFDRSMQIGIIGGISGSTATLGYIGPEIEAFLFELPVH